METRRDFIRQAAAAAAGLALVPTASAEAAPSSAYGVQLYTVRNEIIDQPARVLTAIGKIGYKAVETFAGQYTRPAAELRSLITDAGLTVPSTHFSYADLGSRFEYCKELGARDIVCGAEPATMADSADGFKRVAQQYNQWGEQAHKMGLRFGFHNHNFEFRDFAGRTGLEILLAETDPALVFWQMDVYWVTQSGNDPLTLMRRYRNRLQTMHFKDRKPGFPASTMTNKESQHFTEVGNGTVGFRPIWDYASAAAVKYFFVEQDTTEIPPLESLAVSYKNLRRILA